MKLTLPEKIMIALVIAVFAHVLSIRRAPAQAFIPSGEWITTERGDKVCQTTLTIARGMQSPGPGFCTNWQEPHRPMFRGQQWPVASGWVRFAPSLQFHTEQGWKP